jgi:isopenicillin N synthase-like dioxygenase
VRRTGGLTGAQGRASIAADMRAGLPILDMKPLLGAGGDAGHEALAGEIRAACRDCGFFYVVGHGAPPALLHALAAASRRFFALPTALKQEIAMARAGRAWRGWFPVGGELTAGAPDLKEGLYFGSELASDHPRVRARVPMHGANLFPAQVPELRELVLRYIDAMTTVAHALLVGVARSLGLPGDYFARHYTADPTVLFRVFHYRRRRRRRAGASGSTPIMACSHCWRRTRSAVCRSRRRADGSTRRRSRGRWCATLAICLTA